MKLPAERGKRIRLAAIVAVAIAALLLLESRLGEVDLEAALADISAALGDLTYLFVGLLAFLETGAFVGLLAPGETFVILGGAVAGQGETSIVLTLGIVWFCAWAGDTVSFLIGRSKGRGFVLRHGPKLRITEQRFGQVESYFRRHGGKTILIGRFIGLVRALAPFVAGSSGMRYRDFAPYSVLGTGLWAATFSLLGYFGSRSLNQVADVAGRGTFLFALVVGTIVAIVVGVRYLREPKNRQRLVERMEGNRLLRPLLLVGRRLAPPARFLVDRLTPGGLGLELTALFAAFAVAVYVFAAYAITIGEDPGQTLADRAAFDVSADLRMGWLTDLNEIVTSLGAAGVTLAIGLGAAIGLGLRRRWAELAVLVAALAITHFAVPVLKEAFDRPRPDDPLVGGLVGDAFPSGHAAYSAIYPWLALTVALRLRAGRAGGTALIVIGILIAAAIGLSRVYLRAHYLSDVSAGWAFGVAAFCGCAILALVVTHLRQNQTE